MGHCGKFWNIYLFFSGNTGLGLLFAVGLIISILEITKKVTVIFQPYASPKKTDIYVSLDLPILVSLTSFGRLNALGSQKL